MDFDSMFSDDMDDMNMEEFDVLDVSDPGAMREYAQLFLKASSSVTEPLIEGRDIEWRELVALASTLIVAGMDDASNATPTTHKAITMGTMMALLVGYVVAKDPELVRRIREEMRQKYGTEKIDKERIEEAKRNVYSSLNLHSDEEKLKNILKGIEIDLDDR